MEPTTRIKLSPWLFITIMMSFYILLCDIPANGANRTDNIRIATTDDSAIERDVDFRFFLAHLASVYITNQHYGQFLLALDFLDMNRYGIETRRAILYYKAECNSALKNYNLAYEQYSCLRMLFTDKSDPLYNEVLDKLTTAGKRKDSFSQKIRTQMQVINTNPRLLWKEGVLILAFLFCLSLLSIAFLRLSRNPNLNLDYTLSFLNNPIFPIIRKPPKRSDQEVRPESLQSLNPEIIDKQLLITEKEMLMQDGRVPTFMKKEVESKEVPSEAENTFNLITAGHQMIRRLNRCVPYSLVFILKFPFLRKIPSFWANTMFGFAFVGSWTGLSYAVDVMLLKNDPPELVPRFLVTAVLIAVLSGTRIMSQRTIDGIDELVTLIEKKDTLDRLEHWLQSLFQSQWQFFVAATLYLIYIFECIARKDYSPVDFIFVALLMLLSSPMIWFMLRGMVVTRYIAGIKDLQINPLSPLKTLGLQKWISILGSYALVGSIVLTVGGSIPILSAFLRGDEYTFWELIWLFLFMPLVIATWIYPYAKMKTLVKKSKIRRMHYFKTMISQSFKDWLIIEKQIQKYRCESEECGNEEQMLRKTLSKRSAMFKKVKPQIDQMKSYYEVFKEIDQSPESFFDVQAALELAQVMGLPTLFALITYFYKTL